MKIDYKSTINKYNGDPAKNEKGEDMTLGSMVITALNTVTEKDKGLTAEQKIHRAIISQDIFNAIKEDGEGFVDLPIEDINMIQELMTPLYPPLSIMRAWKIFDPDKEFK